MENSELICINCGYHGPVDDFDIDYTHHQGFWCPDCDAFTFYDKDMNMKQRLTLWLEDPDLGNVLSAKKKVRQHVSPLRYPGGKSKLSPYIAAMLPEGTTRLVEPYCGGASVSLSMLLSGIVKEIRINDKEPGVYALFRTIVTDPEYLIGRIKNEPASQDTYFRYQDAVLSGKAMDEREFGFRYLYCNRLSFSGIITAYPKSVVTDRYNAKTLEKRIIDIWEQRDHIEVTSDDALTVIEEEFWKGESTFQFIDPPYFEKGKRLYPNAYGTNDHQELCSLVEDLKTGFPGSIMLITYDNNLFVRNLYTVPETEVIRTRYSI